MVCRWPQSQEGDWARPRLCKIARHGPWPVRKRFIRDHVWRGRWKPGCRIVGSVTAVWLTTEADDICHVWPHWPYSLLSNISDVILRSVSLWCSWFSWRRWLLQSSVSFLQSCLSLLQSCLPLLQSCLPLLQSCLPVDKPRLLPGAWSPSSVIRAVRLGVDIFDSSFPFCTPAASN